ncbi:hypothetical protein glysoja_027147 [Glycine soja]|uniref:Uncharacterized protein n=1 Tax=Glycine soja TaxID=3848 RepID=A0A0B2Q3H7_GLYSO|nr:hypothetical protein glysoja_027147 [Glycine soja]
MEPCGVKRQITWRSTLFLENATSPSNSAATGGTRCWRLRALLGIARKKLRRLPHVFSCVLELPFRFDADVAVEEAPNFFRFMAETDGIDDVRAHTVEIHPGVTKIVVREGGSVELSLDQLELDMWRFRLPESMRPELASAV